VVEKCSHNDYGLVIIGSADERTGYSGFGSVCEGVVEKSPFSVLAVRRHTSVAATWLRHQAKHLQTD
jgi:nucleotide-binding universal stress UspA family protein